MKDNIVSLIRCDNYELDNVLHKLEILIANLGGISKFVHKDARVLIKPNLMSPYKPAKMITTHPILIEALCIILKKAEATICIGESSLSSTDKAFSTCGVSELAKKYGISIINFDNHEYEYKKTTIGTIKEIPVTKILNEVDVVINLPKLKMHYSQMYTGAVKNLYGTVPDKLKLQLHGKAGNIKSNFEDMLLNLPQIIKPKLNIIDAIWGLEGNGPAAGTPKKTGYLIAADHCCPVF
jgi:uncharacterized protein (DUF362 family)